MKRSCSPAQLVGAVTLACVALCAYALPPFIGPDRIPSAANPLCPSDALIIWSPSGTYGNWATTSTNETGLPATLASEADFCTIYSLNLSETNATSLTIASLPDLGYIDASDCALTSVSISNCVTLTEMYFNFNQLSTPQVNQILYQLSTNSVDNGIVHLENQTPAAPPDSGPPDGATAVITLQNKGWIVVTD